MAVVVHTPLINAAAWRDMLRGIWNAVPTASSAIAIERLVTHMAQSALALVGGIEGDIFLRRSLAGWREDLSSLFDRLEWYARETQRAVAETPPNIDADTGEGFVFVPSPDRVSQLTANVIGPILNGHFPVDFPATVQPGISEDAPELVASMRRGLTEQADGRWHGQPDAFVAVSLWNRAVEALVVDVEQGQADLPFLPDVLREWVSQAEVDLQQSAPGEPKTTADTVVEALEAIKDKALEIAKGAWSLFELFAFGAGVGLLLYVLWRHWPRKSVRAA